MKGSKEVLEVLNEVLAGELVAINQYFLHAKICKNWGYEALAKKSREESIDEMKHAEKITDRILFLEGLPNYQRLQPLKIGQMLAEMFAADMDIEVAAVNRLREGAAHMRKVGDITSSRLFEDILADEEHHIDYLETQQALLEQLGEALYVAQLVEQPEQ